MAVLRSKNNRPMASTRGYLVFQKKDKVILLSNQITTLPEEGHIPRDHIARIKNEILEFRDSLEFN